MSFEWALNTPVTKVFRTVVTSSQTRQVPGVGEDGEPGVLDVEEKTEHETEVSRDANVVRVRSAANDHNQARFHIRLIYGRSVNGVFEGSIRDDGIIIGGPEYQALDTNADGLISEDEILSMSAKILGWDGELVALTAEPTVTREEE